MIKNIKLNDFRLFSDYNISFKEGLNILVGENGVGKTSIIEAVYLASTTKSFRTSYFNSLVKNDENKMNVTIETTEKMYYLYFDGGKKLFKINNTPYKRLKDYVGDFKTVVFSSYDLNLIDGTKSDRRHFLDIEISMLNKNYLSSISKYKKLIDEKNEVLKSAKIDEIYMKLLNENLANLIKVIYEERISFLELLNKKDITKKINFNSVKLEYQKTYDALDIYKSLYDKLESDIKTKSSQIGTHRDDFVIKIAGYDAKEYASLGQKRLIVVLIKVALKKIIEEKEEVVLLLDDVFAALDKNRIKDIVNYIKDSKQVLITTTSVDEIPKELLLDSNIIEIGEK